MRKYSISDESGLHIDLCDFGARIIGIQVPHRGQLTKLTRDFAHLHDYKNDAFYLGATVGPIANRIENGKLSIQQKNYQLPLNHGAHCLHSGNLGLDKMIWRCHAHEQDKATFSLSFPQRGSALPGNLEVIVDYCVANKQLRIDYHASTDRTTYLNLTNHVYFNLSGMDDRLHQHEFTLYANAYAEKNNKDIPTGKLVSIEKPLNYSILDQSTDAGLRGQVDHHFIVDEKVQDHSIKPFTHIRSDTGIELLISSTKPGFQFYTGQFLSAPFKPFGGFCIEPQFVPNAINQPEFNSPLTTPDAPYKHSTLMDFVWEG